MPRKRHQQQGASVNNPQIGVQQMEVDGESETPPMDQGSSESSNESSDDEIPENPLVPEFDFKLMSETIEQIKDCQYFKVITFLFLILQFNNCFYSKL